MRDAPYIREAEMHGYPHRPIVLCPVCGQSCKTIFASGPDAFGCEHCVDVMDSETWKEEMEEH